MYKLNLAGSPATPVTSLLTRNQPRHNCVRHSLSEDATEPRAVNLHAEFKLDSSFAFLNCCLHAPFKWSVDQSLKIGGIK